MSWFVTCSPRPIMERKVCKHTLFETFEKLFEIMTNKSKARGAKRNGTESVTTDFCANPRIGNKIFSLKFCTYWDVFDHFYNPTQINDVLGPSGSEKKGLLKYNF